MSKGSMKYIYKKAKRFISYMYECDKDGKPVRCIQRDVIEYDRAQRIVLQEFYDANNRCFNRSVREYNDDGSVRETTYPEPNLPEGLEDIEGGKREFVEKPRTTITKEKIVRQGNLTYKVWESYEPENPGQLKTRIATVFYSSGEEFRRSTFDKDGNHVYSSYKRYKYDKKTGTREETEYDHVQNGRSHRHRIIRKSINKYDKPGRLVECVSKNSKYKVTSRFIMKYDENGRLVEDINYLSDGTIHRTTYKYNDYGDIIEQWWYNQKNLETPYMILIEEYEFWE